MDLHLNFNCTDDYLGKECPLGHLTYIGRLQHYLLGFQFQF
jgi:hypothetical protein